MILYLILYFSQVQVLNNAYHVHVYNQHNIYNYIKCDFRMFNITKYCIFITISE